MRSVPRRRISSALTEPLLLTTDASRIDGQISPISSLRETLLTVDVMRSPTPSRIAIWPVNGQSVQIDAGSAGTVTARPTLSVTVTPSATVPAEGFAQDDNAQSAREMHNKSESKRFVMFRRPPYRPCAAA